MNRKYDKIKHGDYFKKETVSALHLPTPPSHITGMNIPYMWEKGYKGKGIKISIIDSGCDLDNKLLKNKIVHYCNMTDDDNGDESIMNDYMGHGTHIAGLIAADSYEEKVMGIAPECELYIYKVLDKDGYANYDTIQRAIYASISKGVDIINISLAGSGEAPQVEQAIKEAIQAQISVVVSSGNDGDNDGETEEISFPSCYEEVIAVGSITNKNKVSKFSNTNKFVDCVSYGEDILSTSVSNNFEVLTGTSQAAPLVVGALALLKQWAKEEYKRNLTEVEMYSLLIKNTKSIKGANRNQQGHGRIYLEPYISKEK